MALGVAFEVSMKEEQELVKQRMGGRAFQAERMA